MISFLDSLFFEESVSKLVADNENKATSAPDIKAEQISKTNKTMILVIWVLLNIISKNKLGGSASKILV